MNDLRFALRLLGKDPGFSAIAVLTLALGIGANTALFSLVNKVLLTPLPFRDPQRLVMIWSTDLENKINQSSSSGPDFIDWRKQSRSFEGLAAAGFGRVFNLIGDGEPMALKGALVTPSFFSVFGMGMTMKLGRPLTDEDSRPGQEQRLVLSHGLWQRRFGGDPNILGRSLNLNGRPSVVVGVLAPTLGFVEDLVEVYAPLMDDQLEANRMNHYLVVFGRLKTGVTLEQAQAELATIQKALGQQYPDQKGWSVYLRFLHEELVRDVRPAFLVLHGAVALVLLIACANVANLLLSRAEGRSKEMAIRASLGASRIRVVRQLLTESLVLSLAGAALGVFFAHWAIHLLKALSPRIGDRGIPYLDEIGLDGRVLGFTLVVSIAAGVLFGLAPAWHAARTGVAETLKEGGRSGTGSARRHWLLGGFAVAQVALSVILLVGAGLLIKNLHRLAHVHPGFEPRQVLSMQLLLPQARYTNGALRWNFARDVLQRIEALPGVESAAFANILPMANDNSNWAFEIEGDSPLPKGKYNLSEYRTVSAEYFTAMKVRRQRGRVFSERDDGTGLRVMVVNETFAKRYFANREPLGRRIQFFGSTNAYEIVGLVGDERQSGLGAPVPPVMYQPLPQDCWNRMGLVARTRVDPLSLAGPIRQQIWAVDKDLPVTKVQKMTQGLADSIAIPRFAAVLLGGFAGVGLVLAAIGIYGVLAYGVSQRTHEIGVRMALGAEVRDILQMVMRHGLRLAGLGLAVGLTGALAFQRVLGRLLSEMTATDPLTFVTVIFVLGAVALVACYFPARRASKVDPMVALRYE